MHFCSVAPQQPVSEKIYLTAGSSSCLMRQTEKRTQACLLTRVAAEPLYERRKIMTEEKKCGQIGGRCGAGCSMVSEEFYWAGRVLTGQAAVRGLFC